MENLRWKTKMHKMLQSCHEEIKKTSQIGKKMLVASKTNTSLKKNHEKLGLLVVEALKNKEIVWDNPKVNSIIKEISSCIEELENLEGEVSEIKLNKSKDDISKKN